MKYDIISIGIDPGFANIGMSIVAKRGSQFFSLGFVTFTTKKDKIERTQGIRVADDDVRRTSEIYLAVKEAATLNEVQLAGIESFAPFTGKGGWKATLGYAAAICALRSLDIPIYTFSPGDIKVLITDKKSSTKQDVRDYIESRYIKDINWPGPKTKLEHQGDATAAAILVIVERDRLRKQLCIE